MKQLTPEQIGIDYRAWLDLRMLVGGWSYPQGLSQAALPAVSLHVALRATSHRLLEGC